MTAPWQHTQRRPGPTRGLRVMVLLAAIGAAAEASGQPGSEPPGKSVARDPSTAAKTAEFEVGAAAREVTPAGAVPLWGYGARHDQLSRGTLDPLWAKALVVQAGGTKLAIVGLDLGRGPTPAMMAQIRQAVAPRGIEWLLICGSHTHHGPVIELTDQPGFGQGRFDTAVAYARSLPSLISAAILEADDRRQPAQMGIAAADLGLNRNRHTRRAVKPTDPRLTVLRFDRLDGAPLALLVHYTAHPVLTPAERLEFSADYPGALRARVETELKAPCIFIQGAAGDQSANPPPDCRSARAYGERLAEHALALARQVRTAVPPRPELTGYTDRFRFSTRVNFRSAITLALYSRAFFPELIRNFAREFENGMEPELTTVLLNQELAIVGVPGEPFCQHALRLRERAYLPHALVFGYCNGHWLYFPTIEAASEGGYGADPRVSPVELGAGEAMMNRALINIYRGLGRFPDPAVSGAGP